MRRIAPIVATILLICMLGIVVPMVLVGVYQAFRSSQVSSLPFGGLGSVDHLEYRLFRADEEERSIALRAMLRVRGQLEPADLKMLLRLVCEQSLPEQDLDRALTALRDPGSLFESQLMEALLRTDTCREPLQARFVIFELLNRFDRRYWRIAHDAPDAVQRAEEIYIERREAGRAF